MKHYLCPNGDIRAFELDGSQDFLITPEMRLLTDSELARILKDRDGAAIVAEMPSVTKIKLDHLRAIRSMVYTALGGLQAQALATGDMDTAKSIVPLQVALRDITNVDVSQCRTPTEIEEVYAAAWKAIAAQAPASVVSAFNAAL